MDWQQNRWTRRLAPRASSGSACDKRDSALLDAGWEAAGAGHRPLHWTRGRRVSTYLHKFDKNW